MDSYDPADIGAVTAMYLDQTQALRTRGDLETLSVDLAIAIRTCLRGDRLWDLADDVRACLVTMHVIIMDLEDGSTAWCWDFPAKRIAGLFSGGDSVPT